jgi:transposase-like protein
MTKPIARDPIYRRRRFETEIIELCVRWYITYRLSYRDFVAMMAERGLAVSQTILRFLLRPDRGIAAAQAFFRKALATSLPRWPRKITLDGHAPSQQALRLLRRGSMSSSGSVPT